MADARATTVATNYAREAMEDIKNMDFGEIPTPEIESGSVTVNGITYNRQVIVQENTNIKRVITTVTWKDRNGKQKMVETDMAVHFIETTAGDAIRIMLYADPYNVLVLEEGDEPDDENESIITAVIKDTRGNTITDWDKEVNFSLTGSGSLSSTTTPPGNPITILPDNFVNGKAIITFTSATVSEEVIITASTEGLTPDLVTIKVYNPGIPVKINLTAENYSMTPSIESTSLITAEIFDAANTLVESNEINITFNVTGPGTLPEDATETTLNGEAEILLTSDGTAGTIIVTARASVDDLDLEPGVVVVLTGGYITLEASPTMVPNYGQSVITVTIEDVYHAPINYNGNIYLETSNSSIGTVFPNMITFRTTSSETTEFTAISEGTVEITATDSVILSSNILPLTVIEELTPHHIIVYAMPLNIPAGGTKTSLITAKVMTEDNVKVTSYNESVTFTTTAGSLESSDTVFEEGIATAVLNPGDPGTATITVCSPSGSCTYSGETTVGFYIGPHHIKLTAEPSIILVGGKYCTVTAEILDNNDFVISDYNEDIAFSISPWPDTIKFSHATTAFLTKKVKKGIATVILKSGTTAGTAVMDAYSGDISGTLDFPVVINLILADPPEIDYSIGPPYYVSFDIDIQGADLILEEMQVSWDSLGDETLNKIEIEIEEEETIIYNDDPNSTVGSIEYTDDFNVMIADVNVSDITLPTGTYNITMFFSTNMFVKDILDVTFNPNSGDYKVNLKGQ